jgi:hypothetical protein
VNLRSNFDKCHENFFCEQNALAYYAGAFDKVTQHSAEQQRHDILPNDTQNNDTPHNDTQHYGLIWDTQHQHNEWRSVMSVIMLSVAIT